MADPPYYMSEYSMSHIILLWYFIIKTSLDRKSVV